MRQRRFTSQQYSHTASAGCFPNNIFKLPDSQKKLQCHDLTRAQADHSHRLASALATAARIFFQFLLVEAIFPSGAMTT